MVAILIACPLEGGLSVGLHAAALVYIPRLAQADLAVTLVRLRPTVLVTRSVPPSAILETWRSVVPSGSLSIVVLDRISKPILPTDIAGIAVYECSGNDSITVLAKVDRLVAAARWNHGPATRFAGGDVTLVGAGIVNLITALRLRQSGFVVSVVDASPDPRTGAHWSRYGCTNGGANARMFTLTEADVYRPGVAGTTQFGVPASDGGWRVRDAEPTLSRAEDAWLADHQALPGWLADVYATDVYRFNRESGQHWRRMRRERPDLFEQVQACDEIVRLYSRHRYMHADLRRHRRLRLRTRHLRPAQVARRHPALADACAANLVAGAIEVPGFTLAIHDLVAALLSALEELGVHLAWDTPVQRVCWAGGRVTGLRTHAGIIVSDHYVLSPGVARGELFRQTSADGLVQGVLGVWLTLPASDPPLTHSLKIKRRSVLARDTNVTVAGGALVLGSGYGWTGTDPEAVDAEQLRLISAALMDTAHRYFPASFAQLDRDAVATRYCVRPWTASGLGVFASHPTDRGGLLFVTGGHNTGGFTQAPAVAEAVLAALRRWPHPMHTLYHPSRTAWWRPSAASAV